MTVNNGYDITHFFCNKTTIDKGIEYLYYITYD